MTDMQWLKSHSGFGFSPYLSSVTLTDSVGSLKAQINVGILTEGMQKLNSQHNKELTNGQELLNLDDSLVVFGVWIFGEDIPEIAFFTIAEQNMGFVDWGLLSFLKIVIRQVLAIFTKNNKVSVLCVCFVFRHLVAV